MSGAIIISLAQFKAGRLDAKPCRTAFEPHALHPGNDFNEVGHRLTGLARFIREGGHPTYEQLAQALDRLSANAHAACKEVRKVEFRMRRAERMLESKKTVHRCKGRNRKKFCAKRKRS